MTVQIDEQIELLRETLVGKFGVKLIFLFGSHAYGEASPESDLDICIVTDLRNKRKIDLMREIRRALVDLIANPLDILVYSEDEFSERARPSSTLEHKIMRDGVKVYG